MLKKLAYMSILTSLLGSNFLALNLGILNLSFFRISILIICIIGIMVILLRTGTIKATWKKNNKFSIIFMIFWLLYSIYTLAWAKDYSDWIQAIFYLLIGVICILIYSYIFKSSADILKAFYVISIMIVFHNCIGWYEIITGNYLFLTNSIDVYSLYSYPVSIFGNTNNFALFMLFSIYISYICLTCTTRVILKGFYTLTIFSSIYLLIMTTSRAGILGLIISSILFTILSIRTKAGRYTLVLILGLIGGLYLFFPMIIESFLLKIDTNLAFNRFNISGSSDSVRINLIKNGLVFLLATYGFGVGAGNISHWMSNFSQYPTWGAIDIHNWWLEIAVSYGLIIFILYILFYLKLFKDFYLVYKKPKSKIDLNISVGLMCCMLAFLIGSVGASSLMIVEWLWVFWGILIAYQGLLIRKISG